MILIGYRHGLRASELCALQWVAGRAGHRPATRPQGEERLAECPPDAGRRDTRAATSAARTGAVLARLYDRAGRADDAHGLPCAIPSDWGPGQDAVSDPSAHAAAWLRLCPSQRRPRHAGTASLAGAQEHSTHRALPRPSAGKVQVFLALAPARHAYQSSCSLTRRSDVRFRGQSGHRSTTGRINSDAIDPERTLRALKSRSAAASCRAHAVLAATNKCLAQSNKSRMGPPRQARSTIR